MRYIYGVGDWPEDDQNDFLILVIREDEGDDEAFARATLCYDNVDFYIVDDNE